MNRNALPYWRYATLLAIATVCTVFLGTESAPEDEEDPPRIVAVVTHVDNPLESIARSELARIFLKQQSTWPDGSRCIPIDQRGDSKIRREFSKLVLQRSVYDVKRYWMQETMTGNAKPPVSLESAATVKKYLQKIEGAVAYIYLDEVDDTVRVLAVQDVEELAQPEKKPEPPDQGEQVAGEAPEQQAPSP